MKYIALGMKRDRDLSITGLTKHQYYCKRKPGRPGVKPSEDVVRIVGGNKDVNMEYVLRDHLGNTRVTFADINDDGLIDRNPQNGEILKIAHYYPFGLEMEGE